MDQLVRKAVRELVIANRVLSMEAVLDGYGHVSVRHPLHPDQYLISCSQSPDQVSPADIAACYLDGSPVSPDDRPPYSERFIHGAIYESRADLNAVVHSHAEDVLPFSISDEPFVPVIHVASNMGERAPVWDIADKFGDATTLLVVNMAQGRDLAKCLCNSQVVLMRGHGFSAGARSLAELVKLAVYIPRNARVLTTASRFGRFKCLSAGEIRARADSPHNQPDAPDMQRAWAYWSKRAGCDGLFEEQAEHPTKPTL